MDLMYEIYNNKRTVFRLKDVSMLIGETNFSLLNQRLNYFVRTKKLLNPRKGVYCKPDYNPVELACRIFVPAYVSLEYVLARAGVVFQYDSRITVLSYLSREIEVEGQTISFRKIKDSILINTEGIDRQRDYVNIASPERAFLDMVYLNSSMYFDNLHPLNKEKIAQILPVYQSVKMDKVVEKMLKQDGYK
ncbi:MAG: hypothetical protein LBK94_08025 [Prevotellaceae bacterium]|nr:hypothetical protein [Prevotellaceae bacterium]